ncbi:hypothetical protein BUALT_Bualt05G0128800 [Buddleja alternifolia]|uniref:AP2/ERF domain-containing protein n=1 Tax=Buddleja alternifolia TaxID=168488 RepID=A0AAV6XN46_9LAMI|nr:hypothetical protein BUALT_Bualt05G0128800 [Buddleja alternifolia]
MVHQKDLRRSKRLSVLTKRRSIRIANKNPNSTPSSSPKNRNSKNGKRNSRKKYKGVQITKSGKYVSLIWDPFKKRCVWLGTFGIAEEASEMYISKKREFDEKLNAKWGIEETPFSVESNETSHDHNKFMEEEAEVGNIQEPEFGVLFGVRIIDNHGFLLGEFSKLDDLSIIEFWS